MTSKIIYHDFRSNDPISTITEPESTVCLTAGVLAKGRPLVAVNRKLNTACTALCIACIAVSIFVFGALFGSGCLWVMP